MGSDIKFSVPVLEPDLHRTLGHVDILRDLLSDSGGGSGILLEFHLEGDELVLGGALALVVLLLLRQGALARRTAGGGASSRTITWSGVRTGHRG